MGNVPERLRNMGNRMKDATRSLSGVPGRRSRTNSEKHNFKRK